jgi:RNA polymerase sigma-70 factor (ECF subfamily)
MPNPSDADLVEQVLAGRNEAYAELVARYAGKVYAVCRAKVWRPDMTADLVQQTLLRGFEDLSRLEEPAEFGHWLCNIARNVCTAWLRKGERAEVTAGSWEYAVDDAGLAAVDDDDELQHLMREVRRLPDELREVVTLYYFLDATHQEMAEFLGVARATVNARLARARKTLRDRLGDPQTT